MDFQGIPPSSSSTVRAQAAAVTDTTASIASQTEQALKDELDARKAAYEAQLTQAEKIAHDNKLIEIENSAATKQYQADLEKYNAQVAEIEEARIKAKVDFEKADLEYKNAVRASDARAAEIKEVRAKNAKILADNEEALAAAKAQLASSKSAQQAYVLSKLDELSSIAANKRTLIIVTYIRRTRVFQFASTVAARGIAIASRAGVAIASSAAGRLAGRIAGSRTGQLLGRAGGELIGPSVNIGLGFYTAATEGLFDD